MHGSLKVNSGAPFSPVISSLDIIYVWKELSCFSKRTDLSVQMASCAQKEKKSENTLCVCVRKREGGRKRARYTSWWECYQSLKVSGAQKAQHVLSPYLSFIRSFSLWQRQLWPALVLQWNRTRLCSGSLIVLTPHHLAFSFSSSLCKCSWHDTLLSSSRDNV